MARKSKIDTLVDQTLLILSELGIPMHGMTHRRKTKMAKAFLSVAGMKPGMSWSDASADNRLRSRDVIRWMNEYLGESVSPGSYDDIRRKDLLLAVEAGIVLKSAGKEDAATNDGTRAFALSPETAEVLRFYGTPLWDANLATFLAGRETLAAQLQRERNQSRIPIQFGSTKLDFGPGEHNELQKKIIEEFLPCFGYGAEVLYVGDTEDRLLFLDSKRLNELGFFELGAEKLPDVLAYSKEKNWLFLIEAVHSANPITEIRKRTLDSLIRSCTADIVYVTAFLNRAAFKKFAHEIAWETEVWVAEAPEHLIHFNGDKFLGPYLSAV